MAKPVVGSSLPPRDGTALVRARRGAGAPATPVAVAAGVVAPDRLVLSGKAVAQIGEEAKGFFARIGDRGRELLDQAKFWVGIGAAESRDWVERKVVVPWALWRGGTERNLAFNDAAGRPAEAKLEAVGVIGGNQTFLVSYGAHSFQAEIPTGLDADDVLKKALNFFSQVPAHLRQPLKVLSVASEHNPMDPYNEKKYGIEGFTSAATAGGGVITFWDGISNLRKGTFNHEMGHLIGSALHDRDADALGDFINTFQQMATPHDWKDVARKDDNWVSSYAKTNPDEDFAEHWEAYVEAREDGPKALETFRKTYPNRASVLEAVFEGAKP